MTKSYNQKLVALREADYMKIKMYCTEKNLRMVNFIGAISKAFIDAETLVKPSSWRKQNEQKNR